jgi:hypothetical protein
MKNFTVKSIYQDSNGRYTIFAMSEDNDTLNLNTADKGDFEVGDVVEIGHEQDSASPVAMAQAAEQGQPFRWQHR